jgi:hypothetical protein
LKDQFVKKLCVLLALASLFASARVQAISLDDIPLWTGSGTNRAALVIEWSVPESAAGSTVPAPVADKTLAWGYRFNGTPTATQLLKAILAADPKLYVVADETYGTFVEGIGYNLSGNNVIGITDGVITNSITNGYLSTATVNPDVSAPITPGDLFWSGEFGPNWETWTEAGDAGGFFSSPNRGTNDYWLADDPTTSYSGVHGQWEYSSTGLDSLLLTNGSWIAFSVAAGEYESDTNAPYNLHKHAPPSPDGTYTAYVCNTNDFATAIVSTNNIDATSPYNNPLAVLGRPTLKFLDHYGTKTAHRSKIIEPPYWTDPATNDVITEITAGGQITVNLGRKVYDDPNNPYGIDLIIYGNSFFSPAGASGTVGDLTDLDVPTLSSGAYGHATTVSVSQDGTNWFSYATVTNLFPDNAYRWDETNHSWTDEEMNPTKPLNPYFVATNFGGETVASGLDQFVGAAGGTGYALKGSGFPWIQYVRITPGTNTYTVIDAIAAVNPAVVGDQLSIVPENLAAGLTNLAFQNPADASDNWISLNFDAISEIAKVSTVSLHEFSAYAPVPGHVSSASQIAVKPILGANAVSYLADLTLHPADDYSGTGGDLRLWQWSGAKWAALGFVYNATNREIVVAGVTNLSAYVVSQIIPPALGIRRPTIGQGPAFAFTPVPNCQHTLQRSTDLVSWTTVATLTPTNESPVSLQDNSALSDKAFYRLIVTLP